MSMGIITGTRIINLGAAAKDLFIYAEGLSMREALAAANKWAIGQIT